MIWLIQARHAVDYDEYRGFIVRAPTEAAARKQATEASHDFLTTLNENWLSDEFASCIGIDPDGEDTVLLSDFKAG